MVRIGVFTLFSVAAADTCSLYEIADGSCGQSDLNCAYVKYAKAAEKGLQDGTCADQGYTHQTGTQTKTYPIIGDITVTTYDQGFAAAADTCSLYEIADGSCGQSDLNCAYVRYAKAAEKGLSDGTCADHGYSRQTGTQTKTYPIIGDITVTTYDQGFAAAADTCSLYEIADGSCGQSDLNCAYVKYAKAAEKGLQDGTCADQGYTHQTGTQTKTYPIIGDITVTTYDQGFAAAADTCSLYEIADGSCGQSDLNCAYVKYAKAAEKGLQDGTCADQGYTHQTGTQTKTYPIIGDITVTTYDQGFAAAADTCSLYEIADGSCGQSDLNCAYVKYAKAAEKGLQDGTCADQGYTHQTGTQTKTYPIIGDITVTTYDQGFAAAADTCSLYEIADGSCGQSDLNCAYVKYAKAAEKGLQDGTCADQGYTHQTGTQTKTYPIIGDITVTTYDQGSVSV